MSRRGGDKDLCRTLLYDDESAAQGLCSIISNATLLLFLIRRQHVTVIHKKLKFPVDVYCVNCCLFYIAESSICAVCLKCADHSGVSDCSCTQVPADLLHKTTLRGKTPYSLQIKRFLFFPYTVHMHIHQTH